MCESKDSSQGKFFLYGIFVVLGFKYTACEWIWNRIYGYKPVLLIIQFILSYILSLVLKIFKCLCTEINKCMGEITLCPPLVWYEFGL